MKADIRYGKHEISFYRAHPVAGLLAGVATIDVFGDNFLPAYIEGDNRNVVATDTMKNFVYAMALEFAGQRQEGFAVFLARKFLEHYPQMQSLRVFVRELPFAAHSDKLYSPLADDYGAVELEMGRTGLRSLRCGRRNLRLVKLTGSAFRSFARDGFTTLPEAIDRPLYIFLDVHWRYQKMDDAAQRAAGQGYRPLPSAEYISSEDVREVVRQTFDDFVSMSIQHLVYEMGTRLLGTFSGMSEVSFEAQNRLWDTVKVSNADPVTKVFADPRPAHGDVFLTLRREP